MKLKKIGPQKAP
jgi:hypothetical protein